MDETRKWIEDCYLKANKRDRIVMCAIIIMIAEDRKEDIKLANGIVNGTMDREEILNRIYLKYCPIVQERTAQGRLIR